RFEPNIRGTRNLLDLALTSTAPTGLPRFAFASSISVAGVSGLGEQLEEVSVRPEDATLAMGSSSPLDELDCRHALFAWVNLPEISPAARGTRPTEYPLSLHPRYQYDAYLQQLGCVLD
ncbi:unnamed protein product, partial [Rhizoctonia solani]